MLLLFIFLVLLISVSETGCAEGSLSVDSSFFLCEIMCRFIYFLCKSVKGWSYATTPDVVGSIETPFSCFPGCTYLLPVFSYMRKLERERGQIANPLTNYFLLIHWANQEKLSGELFEPATFNGWWKNPLPCCVQLKQTHPGLYGSCVETLVCVPGHPPPPRPSPTCSRQQSKLFLRLCSCSVS